MSVKSQKPSPIEIKDKWNWSDSGGFFFGKSEIPTPYETSNLLISNFSITIMVYYILFFLYITFDMNPVKLGLYGCIAALIDTLLILPIEAVSFHKKEK